MYHGIVLYCITVGLKFSFRNTEKTKELFLEKQLVSIINHQLGLKPGLMWFRRFTDRWSVGHSVRRRSFHYMKHPHGFSRDFVMIFKPKWRNLTLSGAQRESGRGVDPENTGSSLQESNQLVKGSAFCTEHYFPPLPPHPLLLPPPPLLFSSSHTGHKKLRLTRRRTTRSSIQSRKTSPAQSTVFTMRRRTTMAMMKRML